MTTATLVMTTAPDETWAQRLAQLLLEARLAACVSIIDSVQSHYWWEGKIESSTEKLLLIKTQESHAEAIKALVMQHHPYDLPEILFLPISGGLPSYLEWIEKETRR